MGAQGTLLLPGDEKSHCPVQCGALRKVLIVLLLLLLLLLFAA
jgi:hypothetical protein